MVGSFLGGIEFLMKGKNESTFIVTLCFIFVNWFNNKVCTQRLSGRGNLR
jgi:hypothetical protein